MSPKVRELSPLNPAQTHLFECSTFGEFKEQIDAFSRCESTPCSLGEFILIHVGHNVRKSAAICDDGQEYIGEGYANRLYQATLF